MTVNAQFLHKRVILTFPASQNIPLLSITAEAVGPAAITAARETSLSFAKVGTSLGMSASF
jgi:hypothetical protein